MGGILAGPGRPDAALPGPLLKFQPREGEALEPRLQDFPKWTVRDYQGLLVLIGLPWLPLPRLYMMRGGRTSRGFPAYHCVPLCVCICIYVDIHAYIYIYIDVHGYRHINTYIFFCYLVVGFVSCLAICYSVC